MLIIYAHYNHNGHNGYILETIEKYFKEKQENYEVLDLYKLNFNPVLIEKSDTDQEIKKDN